MNGTPLRVLLAEDSDDDAWLTLNALRQHGYAPEHRHVMTADAFREALESSDWDIILCDYTMPGFDALAALDILRESGRSVPLIVISGTIGEEVAVDALKRGANDYLLKDSLTRLGAAVERELRTASDRRRADEQLREQAALLDKAKDAIIVRDLDQRIRYWNHGAERLYGWTRDEVLGHEAREMLHEDPSLFNEGLRHLMEHGEWSGVLPKRRKDGRALTVEAHWTLVRDDNGRPQSILAINTDITERLALEEQLRQAQRLEAVGQLTGGLAHDFNNLLTVILGNAELLAESLTDQPKLQELAVMTCTAAQRGAELTQRLLAFARRQPLEPQPIDVKQLVTGMDGLLRRVLTEDIDIKRVQTDDPWPAFVDPAQLEAALLNLAINARDAMPEGGCLTIETTNIQLDQDYADRHVEVTPGRYVMLAVSDTGTGIAPEHLKRVFDPFFTTKPTGKGTGLGLSMIYGFVKQSRGHIGIYSEPNHGTTVKLYLPQARQLEETIRESASSASDSPGSETILVAEDDDLVRSHVEAQLKLLGYRVITAHNGLEALEIIQSEADIDLLFTDVIMPGGMNGRELAETAATLRPELKILYTSGYTESAIVHHGRLDEGVRLLQKPYRRAELARKVREVLARSED